MNALHKTALLCLLASGCAVQLTDQLDLQTFSKTPDAINVTGTEQDVVCEMTIPSGAGGSPGDQVLYAACIFESPSGNSEGCLATSAAGDVWSCPVTIPKDSEGGTWGLSYVFAQDDAGNKIFKTAANLEADIPNVIPSAAELDITVTSTNADIVKPVITSFTVFPTNVEPGGSAICSFVIDDPDPSSGIGANGCSFRPSDGSSPVSCSAYDGIGSCSIPIPVTADAGVAFTEIDHYSRDNALNVTVGDLGRGFFTTGGAEEDLWPEGPATTCTLDASIGAGCVCEGSYYTSGYCLTEGYSFTDKPSNTLYVVPGGTGAANGTDWANALDDLPTTPARDTFYWIAAGDYDETLSRTFSTADNGTETIFVRKATDGLHGTETGWQSSYGTGTAVFGTAQFTTDYWVFDGGYYNGIEFRSPALFGAGSPSDVVEFATGSAYVILRNVEIDASFRSSADPGVCAAGGLTTPCHIEGTCHAVGTAGSSNIIFDRVEAFNFADDGMELHACDDCKLLLSKVHLGHGAGTDSLSIPFDGPCFNGHSDGIELMYDSDNFEMIGSMVYDMQAGTGAMIVQDPDQVDTLQGLKFYNNIFYNPGTGLVVNFRDVDDVEFHNNIVWGRPDPLVPGEPCRYGGLALDGDDITDMEISNNIITCINFTAWGGGAHNATEQVLTYNLFGSVDTGQYTPHASDLVSTPAYSTANPFFVGIPYSEDIGVHNSLTGSLSLSDFTPSANNPSINTGVTIGPTFSWSVVGDSRPQGASWDIGAFDSATSNWTGFGGAGGAGGAAGGAGGGGGAPACTGGNYDTPDIVASSGDWSQSSQFSAATSDLTAEVWVRWTEADMDSGIGLTKYNDPYQYDDLAAIARVNSDEIQAYHAGDTAYKCDDGVGGTTCPSYEPNTWYKFTFEADITAGTYDLSYEDCDGTPGLTKLADDFPMRGSVDNHSPLAYYGVWSDPSSGQIEVNHTDGSWSPTCSPLTCSDYGTDPCTTSGCACGAPDDGCGGTLDCETTGACSAPADACDDSYQCCDPDESWCTNNSKDCGLWADNCAQQVDCGPTDCGDGAGGDVCNNGVCCTPESDASACSGLDCGTTLNNCGQTVDCDVVTGGCTGGDVCQGNACVGQSNRGPSGQWPPGFPAYATAAEVTTNGTGGDLQAKLDSGACSDGCVVEHAGTVTGTFNSRAGSGEIVVRPPIGQRADHDITQAILEVDGLLFAGYNHISGQLLVQGNGGSGDGSGFAWIDNDSTNGRIDVYCNQPGQTSKGLFYEIIFRRYGVNSDRGGIRGVGSGSCEMVVIGSMLAGDPECGNPQICGVSAHADTLQIYNPDGASIMTLRDSVFWSSWDKMLQCTKWADEAVTMENLWLADPGYSEAWWPGPRPIWDYPLGGSQAIYCLGTLNNSTASGSYNASNGLIGISNSELYGAQSWTYQDLGGNTILGSPPSIPQFPTPAQLDTIWSP